MTDQISQEVNSEAVEDFQKFFSKNYDERIRLLPDSYDEKDTPSLTVHYQKLERFDSELAEALNEHPDTIFNSAERALQEYTDGEELENADLRIAGHSETESNLIDIRELGRSKHIDKMVTIDGIVKTTSRVLPRVTNAYFVCRSCGTPQSEPQPINPNKLKYPYQCENENCNVTSQKAFQLNKRKSDRVDFQKVVVEEPPEELRGGENPQSTDCFIQGDITGDVTPGDRISVTGVVRADNGNDSPILQDFLEANNIEKEEKEFEEIEISDEDKERIRELSESDDLYERIQKSVAPSIYGHESKKMAVGMQLFSGVTKDAPDTHIRGDIHCLMVGDPGTGKSEIIQSAKELAPRGVYTVGKGTSAAGLTATAVKSSDMGGDQEWSLEAGALVLADKGIACIDEIDKMDNNDRSSLHEALEQQSYAYDTEVLLANGERRKMGELVDELMGENDEEVVDAIDCEILDMEDGELRLHTVDLESGDHTKIDVDRVSRHESPDKMVNITFSNGRQITVTPEHPLYTTENAEISVTDAIDAEVGDFAPAPRELPNSSAEVPLKTNEMGRVSQIQLPETLTTDVAELLGHLTAEGNSYKNESGYVIGYTNSSERLRTRFKALVESIFGSEININYNQSGSSAPTLRVSSKKVYTWFEENHPEVLKYSGDKRIPASVLGASSEHIRRFMVGAYAGDGSVESTSMGISTKSRGLAEDYADALLKIGVASRVESDTSRDEVYYKTTVKGDCHSEFVDLVVEPAGKSVSEARELVFEDSGQHHDVLPTDFVHTIRELKTRVGIPKTGKFKGNIDNGYGIQMSTAEAELNHIEQKVETTLTEIESAESVSGIRESTRLSQSSISNLSGYTTSEINYAENGGYTSEKRERILDDVVDAIQSEFMDVLQKVSRIRELMQLRYETITDVEVVEPESEWVYDLTVEPTRTFVSKGVILHNTISVNKAGINATLKSRCSLLAAANPIYGRFDEYEPVGEQIDLEPALISRFDLMFTITDDPDEELDGNIADHILDLNEEAMRGATSNEEDEEQEVFDDIIDPALLRKYIAYARQNCDPIVTGDQKQKIREYYVELRNQGKDDDGPIPVTARAVQSVVRLSESVARMRLGEEVTEEDIDRALEIKSASLQDVGVDPVTGELDADMTESGTTSRERNKIRGFEEIIKNLTEEYPQEGAPFEEIVERAEDAGFDEDDVEEKLNKLSRQGKVMNPSGSRYTYINR